MSDERNNQIPYTEILRLLVGGIVAFPQNVEIHDKPIDGTHWLSIRVHASDHGKIVGVAGQTISSLQLICETVARYRSALGKREKIKLTVDQPVVGNDSMRGLPFVEALDWDRDSELEELVNKVITQITPVSRVEVEPFGQSTRITLTSSINADMIDALGLLFKAWGKSQGRRIHFVAVG